MPEKKTQFDINVDYNEEEGIIHDYCTSRGFPMGGIGTGGFSIFTDGGFGKFRTNHNWFKSIDQAEYPKGTFFAIRTKKEGKVVAKLLRRDYQGGTEYKNVKNVQHTHFTGKTPFFNLKFEDCEIPIETELKGFTSLIPHDTKDSSLPLAFFQFKLQNDFPNDIETTILFSFENILGIGGSGGWRWIFPFNGPVKYESIKGNISESFSLNNTHGIKFKTRQQYGPKNPRRRVKGEYYIYSDAKSHYSDEVMISKINNWDSSDEKINFWKEFIENGAFNDNMINQVGNSGAFTVKCVIKPNETKVLNFYLVWWMPFYVIEKQQRIRKFFGIHKGKDYGHYHLNHFSTAEELIEYSIKERDRLEQQSRELLDMVEKSTLPQWLKTYVLNSTDSMLINTVLTREGNYYMMEGVPWNWPPGALTGTIDQRLASHVYSCLFFPSLDRNELLGFLDLTRNGRVPHGNGHADVALGTQDVPYGEPIKIFNRTSYWVDLPQSLIMQMGKHIIQSKDRELLNKCWHKFPEMMEYLDNTMLNEVPEGITTYDYMKYHPCFIYTAILHLATLKMIVKLAEIKKDQIITSDTSSSSRISAFINKYRDQYQRTERSYIERLWIEPGNGGGFFKTCESRDTVFTSALAGDWISRFSGLGPVVDIKKAKSHSTWQSKLLIDSHDNSIIKGKRTRPLVYREADLEGKEQPVRVLLYRKYGVNNPWQSTAYQGLEAIYLGRVEAGLNLIKKIWEKGYYEGYPWNMDHWGMDSHIYMTHPALWGIFSALSGIAYDAFEEKLILSPKTIPGQPELLIPVFFPDFWMEFSYQEAVKRVKLKVIKSYDTDLSMKRVINQASDGTEIKIELKESFKFEEGNEIIIDLNEMKVIDN